MRQLLVIRRVPVVALAVAAGLAMAATALAVSSAQPEKGKTYSGTIKRYGTPISFKVSKTGKSVGHFKIQAAPFIFCQGGGAVVKARSAAVSSTGTFKAKLPIKDLNGHSDGHMTVAGRFAQGGKETGQVRVAMKAVAPGSTCNGSSSYATKAG
jgi:hypothetical protein